MEGNVSVGTTPLPLQIKDTLSVIFSQMPLKAIARCARVSKRWKEVVTIAADYIKRYLVPDLNYKSISPSKLNLEPTNSIPAYQFAAMAIQKFPNAKKIKLPKRIDGYVLDDEERIFFEEYYPKGLNSVTTISLPPTMMWVAREDKAREELAMLIIDPLPKSCVNFEFVSFWPELFNHMNTHHSATLKSLHILLNSPYGKVSGPWDSLIQLIKNSTRLETLGLHYFENTSFFSGKPNFNVLTDYLVQVMNSATHLQHLNIPFMFDIDKVVRDMEPMPHLTYLYIQERMTNSLPNTILEKCKNLRLLHLELSPNEYSIASTSLQTLLVAAHGTLKSITIDCPNLEVLKFTGSGSEINEVFVVGEHKLEEFTSKVPIKNGLHGNFDSVKVANQNTLLPANHVQLGLMSNLHTLTLECEAPKTQIIYDSMDALTQLTNLRNLELIKVKRFEMFGAISQLTKLVLRDCETHRIKDNQFMNLTNLKELQLNYCAKIESVKISGCHQLTSLCLFGDEHLRTLEIVDTPNIEEIDIRNTSLNLSSWRQIEKLPNLKVLQALVIPMSSYLKITGLIPTVIISGKKILDRIYTGGIVMLGTPVDWISKEEYDESGPSVRTRKVW